MRHPTLLQSDLLYEFLHGAGKPGFVPATDALLSYDFRDRLPEITAPTLIVQGTEDVLVPAADADEWERLIAHARKVVMPDTGHCPQVERPRQFNEILLEFLAAELPLAPGEQAPADAVTESG